MMLNIYAIGVTHTLLFRVFPQAICSRYGLAIGSVLSYVVWGLIGICFIVSYPVGKLLDWMLGVSHGTFFRRAGTLSIIRSTILQVILTCILELKELISFHERGKSKQTEEPLDKVSQISILSFSVAVVNFLHV